jgi:hypothetical protein
MAVAVCSDLGITHLAISLNPLNGWASAPTDNLNDLAYFVAVVRNGGLVRHCLTASAGRKPLRRQRCYSIVMQHQAFGMPPDGVRMRFVALGLSLIGVAFIAVGTWAFLLPAAADIRAGHILIFTATKAGISWSHVYGFRDHPADFALGLLTKIFGGLGFGGLGAIVSLTCLLRAFGPADIKFAPRGQRLAAAWVFCSAAFIALYFLLWAFPYLLRYGVLS